jgi:Zn-dependent protease with chaperone function
MMKARLYTGSSSTFIEGSLNIKYGRVSFSSETLNFSHPLESTEFSERTGNSPRMIQFPNGAAAEIFDNEQLDAELASEGIKSKGRLIFFLESRARNILLLILSGTAAAAVIYIFGIPLLAKAAAPMVPYEAELFMGETALKEFDKMYLKPSETAENIKSSAAEIWTEHLEAHSKNSVRIDFRKGGMLGANAFALPGRIMIITDELAALTENKYELAAVMAHELGHIELRHNMRLVIKHLTLLAAVTAVTGDINSLAAAVPAVLLRAGYSRQDEREADAFALKLLKKENINPEHFSSILQKLENYHNTGKSKGPGILFSSHPDTEERIKKAGDLTFDK